MWRGLGPSFLPTMTVSTVACWLAACWPAVLRASRGPAGGGGFAPKACQPWSRAHSHPGSKVFRRPQRPMPRRALLLPEAPAPRLPVAPGRAQHSQLRLNLRSGPLPRSALGGITLLISLVWGRRAPKPLEVNAAASLLESAASGHNVAVGMKMRKRKTPRLGFLIGTVLPALRPPAGPPGALFGAAGPRLRAAEPFTASD